MKTPFFTGTCTALVTPFLNGQVNYPMLDILLQRQIDAGLEAVVICGTTGESPTLTDREKKVLMLRFGLIDGRAHTLEEVGRTFDVTRERIRQIEAKALRKLRHQSRSKVLKGFLSDN